MKLRFLQRMNVLSLLSLIFLFAWAVGVGRAQAVTSVHINEVESNGGTPDDWFELYNAGATQVDLSGWKMKDNDDTHPFFVFPSGSTIAAGGYLVFDTQTATTPNGFPFGLGSADSVRIFDPTGTLYETYSWTAHALTTYGRCTNGTGPFMTTVSSTKGAANDCPLALNEVESNGGTPDDWFELYNKGPASIDVTGWEMKDNDDTHPFFVFPTGSTIVPSGFLVFDTQTATTPNGFPFGLGSADSVRIFDPNGTLYETYSWTAHATTTYGRCPDGTGPFTTTLSSTKSTANACGGSTGPASPVKINEIESSGGVPGDWIELHNPSAAIANISGFVLKDNDDTHIFTIPPGTMLAAGSFQAFDVETSFGLGSADSARLFDATGTLIDSYSWTEHAITTYGRCPDGTGAFITTTASTKGAANACPLPWPGGTAVQTSDDINVFGTNLSGLIYQASGTADPGVLWAVRNGPSTIFRLIFNGTIWTPDTADSWGSGKTIVYPSGTGGPDSEGITIGGTSPNDGLYVSTERDNNNNAVSRISILRFDPTNAGATLTATHEWNLTPDLPPSGANLGAEGITFISDSYLTASNFFDAGKGHTYNPAEYPNHGTGLFFVGLESNGHIYGYALDHSGNGAFNRIAEIVSGFPSVMELQLDPVLNHLWAVCDDTCQGRTAIFRIDGSGNFVLAGEFERPAGMPNLNNEGFAVTPQAECVNNLRPVYWSDDSNDDGHALRRGTLSCSQVVNFPDAIAPKASPTASPAPNGMGWNNSDVTVTWNWADNPGGSGIDSANCTTSTLSSGEGVLLLNAACKDLAGNTGNASFTVKVDETDPTVTASGTKADHTPYSFGTWSNQDVTVHYMCSDAGSGIASCSDDVTFTTEGVVSTSGSATDNAGRTGSSGPLMVKIDKTSPQASPTASPAANGTGWNTGDVTVTWNWVDTGGSSIDSFNCPPSTISSGEGVLLLNATCKDAAGNTGNASFTVKVDKTNPIVTASATEADHTTYTFGTWSSQTVTVHYTCSDGGSGIATCPPDAVFSMNGASSTSGNATDNAGRTGNSGVLVIKIDKTAPSVTLTSPAHSSYLNTTNLTIHWSAHDSGSGIASQSASLDGSPVTNGQVIDLFFQRLGPHTLVVKATNGAGMTASDFAHFIVIATESSIRSSIDRLLAMRDITSVSAANNLKAKLGDNPYQLKAFINELDAQRGRKINQQAYDLLKNAALYLIAHPFDPRHDHDFDREPSKPGHGEPEHGDHDSKRDQPNHHDTGHDEPKDHDEYSRR